MRVLKYILGYMQTNCYFLIDDATSKAAVVDPAFDCDGIINKLSEHGLSLEFIVLTHAHFDHMLALEELRRRTGAPLYVHEADEPAVENPELSMMKKYAHEEKGCKLAERLLHDGDILDIGESKIKVMHTPGHTLGSICLISDSFIISGDTLFRENIGRYDFYGGDYNALRESLRRLSALDGDYKIYPGHGSSTTLEHERKNNPYMF